MTEHVTITPATPTLTPHIICAGAADAIEFYKAAFGAVELMRLPGENGKLMHAAISINGAMVMLMDEAEEIGALSPAKLGGTPVVLHIHATDADAAIARAEAAGASVVMPATDMFWGDRYGQVKDPSGHIWSIAHPLRDTVMSEDELRIAARDAQCGIPETAAS